MIWLVVAFVASCCVTPVATAQAAVYDGGVYDAQCQSANALRVTEDGATYRNATFVNSLEAAVRVEADNVTFENVRVENFNCAGTNNYAHAAGIGCFYCSGLRVTDSVIQTARHQGDPLWFKSANKQRGTGGHYIARNTLVGGYDGIGTETERETWGGLVRDTIIEDNNVSECWDDGIQVEGRNQNVIVRRNEVSACAVGVAFAPNLIGPLYIESNNLHDLRPGNYGSVACFKVGRNGRGTAYLTGNTCVAPGDGVMQTNPGLSPIVSRYNVLRVDRYPIWLGFTTPNPKKVSFDYDCLSTPDPERFVRWGKRKWYTDLSSFQAATGQELHGRQDGC